MAVSLLISGYHRHPKMLHANSISGGELAEVLWCRALDYVNTYDTRGQIPTHLPPTLTPVKTAARVKGLVGAGLWLVTPDGWEFHDFYEWNRTADELEAIRQARSAAGKKGAAKRWDGRLGAEVGR